MPRSGPRVSGAAPRYSVGDSVSLNCTSNSSDPLAELSWYINSESVRRVWCVIKEGSHSATCMFPYQFSEYSITVAWHFSITYSESELPGLYDAG